MHSHYTNKLLNIEDVIIKKIRHADTFVEIHLETKPHEQTCPCCGATTKKIHDYRYQTIKDLPFQLKHCYLVLHKRRYVCKCGKSRVSPSFTGTYLSSLTYILKRFIEKGFSACVNTTFLRYDTRSLKFGTPFANWNGISSSPYFNVYANFSSLGTS